MRRPLFVCACSVHNAECTRSRTWTSLYVRVVKDLLHAYCNPIYFSYTLYLIAAQIDGTHDSPSPNNPSHRPSSFVRKFPAEPWNKKQQRQQQKVKRASRTRARLSRRHWPYNSHKCLVNRLDGFGSLPACITYGPRSRIWLILISLLHFFFFFSYIPLRLRGCGRSIQKQKVRASEIRLLVFTCLEC